jgi:CBS domain-containing protein
MKVQDIMTSDVQCCGPDTNLAAAAKRMWDSDCGALPILNVQGQVMGMITDRDICMATATKNKPASDITVWETVSGKAHTCQLADDGVLQGIVAMNDFVLLAGEAKGGKAPALSYEDVVRTMKAISAHRVLVGI